jgi:hypothetical protein
MKNFKEKMDYEAEKLAAKEIVEILKEAELVDGSGLLGASSFIKNKLINQGVI